MVNKGYCVLVDGVLRFDGHVACDVLVVRSPTCEGIAFANRVGRRNSIATIFHHLCCTQYGIVVIDKRDGIGIDGVLRFDSKVGCYKTEVLVPTGEGIAGAFGCRCLGFRTILYYLLGESYVVPINELDGELAQRSLKNSFLHDILGNITYFGCPADKGVVVNIVGFFLRNVRVVSWIVVDLACIEAIDGLYLESGNTFYAVDDIK